MRTRLIALLAHFFPRVGNRLGNRAGTYQVAEKLKHLKGTAFRPYIINLKSVRL
jgi:hypothetical protein